jgi:hypothetical protein
MLPDLAALRVSSALARHAGETHAVHGHNIAHADIPGATARRMPSFADALDALSKGGRPEPLDTRAQIGIEREMAGMAANAGRHATAVTVWSKTLELVRLAGAAPR